MIRADSFKLIFFTAAYVVNAYASDLRPTTLFKFADDTYLLIPGANSHTCVESKQSTSAGSNNLELNQSKFLEIVITAPGVRGADRRAHHQQYTISSESTK